MTKPKYGGYKHIKKPSIKRPGKHAKSFNKRKSHRKFTRGQGK